MTQIANWSYPTMVRFGAGRIKELADACIEAGIQNPLLVTDRGLADLEITRRALDILDEAGLGRAMFSDVDPNPNEINLAAGIKAFKDGHYDGGDCFWWRIRSGSGKDDRFHGRSNTASLGF